MFHKTLIIGLGLMGGSFARALKKAEISREIFAHDLDIEAIAEAKNEGVIDGFTSLEESLSDFDFVVFATPISVYEKILKKFHFPAHTLVIDLGSVKDLKIKNLPKNFVPCHPIAGSELTGYENSAEDLFFGKKFIICPEKAEKNSVKKVEEVIQKIGAKPEFLDAKKHDEIYALVSHLPQFLSFLTAEFSPKKIENEFFKKAFRLDNSDPAMWEDIFKVNEGNIEKFYMKFFDELEILIKNPQITASKPAAKFDEKFFEENFAAIYFRVLVVESYLKIPEIKNFQNYAGSGFEDFTSIISVLNYDQKKLADLIQKNQPKIRKFFDSIS